MVGFELQVVTGRTSLGLALVAGGEAGVCAVLLGEEEEVLRRDLAARFPAATLVDAGAAFRARAASVRAHLDSSDGILDVPLDLRGTPFQRDVWQALREIPRGATASYAELAARVGRPHAVRAVGQAVGANPIAVIIPCHRAIRSDGSLSGYRWGVERKRQLLEREGATVPRLEL